MNFSDRADNSSVEILIGYYYTVRLKRIVCECLQQNDCGLVCGWHNLFMVL